jgi:hypothetical protein
MSVSKQQCDRSRRLELDDGTIRVAEDKLTHQALKKRKVPDDHQRSIRGGQ